MSGLPAIDASMLPADIRNGTPERKKTYEAALGFERMLLQQLTKSLADTAKPVDGSDESQDAASTTYKSMLPDTLADGMLAAGGLGLARQLVPQEPVK
jgi:Rod binding domain-containing protein